MLVVCLLLGLAPPARAAPERALVPAGAAEGRPWAENVPEERQRLALGLFEEGNALFAASEYVAALVKYREALASWDHPAIRYNAAVALIMLDQPMAAHENLELALRHGAAPFAAEAHQQALTYQKLLRGQLAHVVVTCGEAGAEVTLDGSALFVGPGRAERWLMPGAHQLVARKAGFVPATRSLSLLPGKPVVERLTLEEPRAMPLKLARRWDVWKPWAVVGAGAVVALVGVPFLALAKRDFEAFDAAVVAAGCSSSTGCNESQLPSPDDRARIERNVAWSLFGVGAAVAATGAVLLILNQPRSVPSEPAAHAWLLPDIRPGRVGFSLVLR